MDFDLGVVLSSDDQTTFFEFVNLHPGAKRYWDFMVRQGEECECGHTHSDLIIRKSYQYTLYSYLVTRERMMTFLDAIGKFTYPMTDQDFKTFMDVHIAPVQERLSRSNIAILEGLMADTIATLH